MSTYPEADEAQRRHYNDGPPHASAINVPRQTNTRLAPGCLCPECARDDNRVDELSEDSDGDISLLHRNLDPNTAYASGRNVGGPGRLSGGIRGVDGATIGSPGHIHDTRNRISCDSIRQRVPRRYQAVTTVELVRGNFVLDNPVPPALLELCALRNEREFTHMRYSAVTCDPNDFKDAGFTLRQAECSPPRETELFIVITMYNEDEKLFCRTMHGVIENIAHLCRRNRSRTWGNSGWKKVVVCIVSDGRAKIKSRTLTVIAAMGVYQAGVAKTSVGTKAVTAHVYEYTTQIWIKPSLKIRSPKKGIPVQIILCLKEQNQKKINSHRWFFNAFGPILKPNVCVLLDVGTMPAPTSIYHLWKAFETNPNVGGACGEIVALKGPYCRSLINPLVAAQNFEYKISNILDKPLESVFGYITVLPGAFSAYRYVALQNDASGEGPLKQYFFGETMHGAGEGIFAANMYLAEDRILCWELVSKRNAAWTLHYVKSARATTDVPKQVSELISQRRRWLNGSFFAAVYSTFHFYYLYRSSHSFKRKAWLHLEMVYQMFNLIFAWFSLANYYIAFVILGMAIEDPLFGLQNIHIANTVINYIFLGLLLMSFILALGNRPQGSKWFYGMTMIGFACITVYMTFVAYYLAVQSIQAIVREGGLTLETFVDNAIFRNIVISLAGTLGLWVLASLMFLEPWHMITSFVQYLLVAPSYIAVLNVYAFANVHDVSWGTKGSSGPADGLGEARPIRTGDETRNEVEVELPTSEQGIDAVYRNVLETLRTPPSREKATVDTKTASDYYYRNIRTNVLLLWTLSNALLAALVTRYPTEAGKEGAQDIVNGYLAFLLFSIAGLALFRFVGCTVYLVVRLFGK